MGDYPKPCSSDDKNRQYGGKSQRQISAWIAVGILLSLVLLYTSPISANAASSPLVVNRTWEQHGNPGTNRENAEVDVLSPYWGPEIQTWSASIGALSELYGFHPDFIAAVIEQETASNGQSAIDGDSLVAFGIFDQATSMDQFSSGMDGLTSMARLRWGLSVLSFVVRESGGDLFTALAAYRGGWDHIGDPAARDFATRVLDSYARAMVARDGLSPDLAGRWTVAVEIRAGNVPIESMMLLGQKSGIGWRTFSEQTLYASAETDGQTYIVRAYPVPLGLTEFVDEDDSLSDVDSLETPLSGYLGEKSARRASGNPRVLLVCVTSLVRYRDQVMSPRHLLADCPQERR